MIACVDVDYGDTQARAALAAAPTWDAPAATVERVQLHPGAPAAYRPGHFYERELPHLLPLLADLAIATLVVDGYVWLADQHPGLGAHLHAATSIPVVGVAKTRFVGAPCIEISRHHTRALYVTAAGLDVADAAARIAAMAGPYRIPTLIKRADSLARGHATPI